MAENQSQPIPPGHLFQGVDEREAVDAIRAVVLRTLGSLGARLHVECYAPRKASRGHAAPPFAERGFDQEAQSYSRAVANLSLALSRLSDSAVANARQGVLAEALTIHVDAMFDGHAAAKVAEDKPEPVLVDGKPPREAFEARLQMFAAKADPDLAAWRAEMDARRAATAYVGVPDETDEELAPAEGVDDRAKTEVQFVAPPASATGAVAPVPGIAREVSSEGPLDPPVRDGGADPESSLAWPARKSSSTAPVEPQRTPPGPRILTWPDPHLVPPHVASRITPPAPAPQPQRQSAAAAHPPETKTG